MAPRRTLLRPRGWPPPPLRTRSPHRGGRRVAAGPRHAQEAGRVIDWAVRITDDHLMQDLYDFRNGTTEFSGKIIEGMCFVLFFQTKKIIKLALSPNRKRVVELILSFPFADGAKRHAEVCGAPYLNDKLCNSCREQKDK